ncbi:helix-turn-helix domain-containing protein [Chryseobacterium sp. PS-8]|uniref:Helix-turn-helix domain-containing protein n=1 Tax=Chryseobacterium indicum TaxID=2766954 RepID=A0ABS9C7U4_9FLAO|nr:helix-turn-helix domain-containing protein [Chryseobacterium sp. PS-8]MCF2220645.1 helix-turn-helix domain-containing protein [Chryseobacterium sp. PS-8]
MKQPDYIRIYKDIIAEFYPEKLLDSEMIKRIENIRSSEDVISINDLLFKKNINNVNNQKLKSYDKKTILRILSYQKKHNFSNSYISLKYKMSRNTIAKWKKIYINEFETII